ncbi:hypothetical protein SISSUDRAFT_41417 [Sistotremastrum suecicum HHB10207 ss-3]|uniref:Homeobox domain-containing protein n=1 Tax=Sistotremastrum suecicum HHB10207 ss-3 TaxID=1314776 RepID=A0A166H7F7_9AGAM|nr:hypothetical protein SISSUDRAFT_41417 [Sistotremastrum suecicum HHB10207 ss-3]
MPPPAIPQLPQPPFLAHPPAPMLPTAYIPQPKQDRPAPFFSYSPNTVKHRRRTTRAQRKVLEDAFRQNPKPSQYTRKNIMQITSMDRRAVQVWFQNRRAKEKKQANKLKGGSDDKEFSDDEDDEDDDEALTASDPSINLENPQLNAAEHNTSEALAQKLTALSSDSPLPQPSPGHLHTPLTSSDSPGPSTNGAPSPPSATWRVTNAQQNDKQNDFALSNSMYATRRGSAPPGPIATGINMSAPRRAVYQPTPISNTMLAVPPASWESQPLSTTPPSPLSNAIEDEIAAVFPLRRGSLPTHIPHHHPYRLPQQGNSSLPPLISDPLARRRSLQHSKLRLASHPLAAQVAAVNGSIFPADFEQESLRHQGAEQRDLSHLRQHRLSTNVVPSAATQNIRAPPNIAASAQTQAWGNAHDSNSPSPLDRMDHLAYLRPRHSVPDTTQALSSNNLYLFPPRQTHYEQVPPGPLPASDFSFGTATPMQRVFSPSSSAFGQSTPIPEDHGDSVSSYTASTEDGVWSRFGSFASLHSEASQATSLSMAPGIYDQINAHNGATTVNCDDQGQPWGHPELISYMADGRRASCPAPFIQAFSGLAVDHQNNGVHTADSTPHDIRALEPLPATEEESYDHIYVSPPSSDQQHPSPSDSSVKISTSSELAFALGHNSDHSDNSPHHDLLQQQQHQAQTSSFPQQSDPNRDLEQQIHDDLNFGYGGTEHLNAHTAQYDLHQGQNISPFNMMHDNLSHIDDGSTPLPYNLPMFYA